MADLAQAVRVFAPAKINLTLHVTGQRADGYHLLDSLVVFADVGDHLAVHRQDGFSMRVEGREAAAVPADTDNLVLRVAALFKDLQGARFHLLKELPVASGIGGGSADAAAAMRALAALSQAGNAPDMADVLRLGADIPMCVRSDAARVRGIGDRIEPLTDLPPLHAVLVNPRRAVSTPSVFKALRNRNQPPMPETLPHFADASDMAAWLGTQRNDLEAAATSVDPAIAQVKAALEACQGCMLARMSGSGATCFALFADHRTAKNAAARLCEAHPDWWIKPARLGDQSQRAAPQLIRSTT
ncbi:4-diphosphocytidyl-2-C-methyl-D-erythritol kinase [Roseobacter fucihabitans]|uniref:4-diphosphocytidyl-2-C-methyl-D-erythritol kinase n=1 Tax=Roseobacter fucihabitans TaxID=1537242 RepID=A0ABZ2BRY3_9RHOB|nr:4-(cytidine 5'-diphospho)-2-C-methyl-D-erythritol kinase [Roseobacter litoralis]MBC6968091.1 4-diphosphocytidyl-2-C-methyl-D-erythritol kinase [Roseobacter litoralis]